MMSSHLVIRLNGPVLIGLGLRQVERDVCVKLFEEGFPVACLFANPTRPLAPAPMEACETGNRLYRNSGAAGIRSLVFTP